ncbi:hypothetical protein DDE82_001745 [Stemphylium lycopersici]|nr:hypothetical protein DDE82_001745 [Stemphylium lycopersici]
MWPRSDILALLQLVAMVLFAMVHALCYSPPALSQLHRATKNRGSQAAGATMNLAVWTADPQQLSSAGCRLYCLACATACEQVKQALAVYQLRRDRLAYETGRREDSQAGMKRNHGTMFNYPTTGGTTYYDYDYYDYNPSAPPNPLPPHTRQPRQTHPTTTSPTPLIRRPA